ncbi:MAG: transcription repressor NadR [Clostridiaceae bacterium]
MDSRERRKKLENCIVNSCKPLKGSELANMFGVTRQVIVKDIAIIRAAGSNIIATPDGYVTNKENFRYKKVLALSHSRDEMVRELELVIKYGGIIEDVIIEHPIYGELKGNLMIRNLNDLNNFLDKYKQYNAKPLSTLTGGIHLHTISTEKKEDMEMIMKDLEEAGYLLKD